MKFPLMCVGIRFTNSQTASFPYQTKLLSRNKDNPTIFTLLCKNTSKELKAQFYSHLVEKPTIKSLLIFNLITD